MKGNKIISKAFTLLFIISVVSCLASASWAASYYVDSSAGSDGNPGTQSAPWGTVSKVNGVTFAAGDTINFKAGGKWTGTLKPSSGKSGANVVYTSYGTGEKPVLDSCLLNNVSYITFLNLKFLSQSTYAVNSSNMSYVTFQNCEIYNASGNTSYAVMGISMSSHHNKVIGCTLSNLNTSAQNDCLNIYHSNYNLVEGSFIGNATHFALTLEGSNAARPYDTSNYNIIRNNTFNNQKGALIEFQSNANWNVFEGNSVYGGLAGFGNAAPHTMKLVTSNNIVRNNVLRDNSQSSGWGLESVVYQYGSDPGNNAVNNHIYNNVITNIYNNPVALDNYSPGTAVVTTNIYKNNAIYNNGLSNGFQLIVAPTNGVTNNWFINNLFYKSGVSNVLKINNSGMSVATAQDKDSAHYSGNIQKDPMLDAKYRPLAGSPCIDAGDHLTNVTSASGSGTVISVADAGYFSSGFGLVTGDTIRIGSTTSTIQSIDYANKKLTLAAAISWNAGDPVSLPYRGTRPDIGLIELMSSLALSPPTGLVVN